MEREVLISTHNYSIDIDFEDIVNLLRDFEKAYTKKIEELEETVRELEEQLNEKV